MRFVSRGGVTLVPVAVRSVDVKSAITTAAITKVMASTIVTHVTPNSALSPITVATAHQNVDPAESEERQETRGRLEGGGQEVRTRRPPGGGGRVGSAGGGGGAWGGGGGVDGSLLFRSVIAWSQ